MLDINIERLPLWKHLGLLTLLAGGLALACMQLVAHERLSPSKKREELEQLKRKVVQQSGLVAQRPEIDFSGTLASSGTVTDVSKDLARFGSSLGVTIQSMGLQSQAATNTELGSVKYNLTVSSDYTAFKLWLKEILDRHPALGLTNLTLRSSQDRTGRATASLTLVLFLRD